MDTSEAYTKMCDCPEVQDGWIIADGDWFCYAGGIAVTADVLGLQKYVIDGRLFCRIAHPSVGTPKYTIVGERPTEIRLEEREFVFKRYFGCVWLPRQDQVQDMFIWGSVHVCAYKEGGYHLASPSSDYPDYVLYGESLESCWLQFYMKEWHDKAWDGDKWAEEHQNGE